MLKPHNNAKATIKNYVTPKIFILAGALQKMSLFVDISDKEIGWLGSVKQYADSQFLIQDVFLPEQDVAAATCEIQSEGIFKLTEEILLNNPENGVEISNSLRFWGHSHVNMGVSPSGQDDSQINLFKNNDCTYFIRGIANKRGEMRFDLFDFTANIVIEDVPWELYLGSTTELRATITEEISAKCKPISYTYNTYNAANKYTVYSTEDNKADEKKTKEETEKEASSMEQMNTTIVTMEEDGKVVVTIVCDNDVEELFTSSEIDDLAAESINYLNLIFNARCILAKALNKNYSDIVIDEDSAIALAEYMIEYCVTVGYDVPWSFAQ